jgi:hypothetical protein
MPEDLRRPILSGDAESPISNAFGIQAGGGKHKPPPSRLYA